MGGRADYEERKQRRIERYNKLSEQAKQRSSDYSNSTANRILMSTPGQPIIIGHYSEKKARRLHEKAWEDTRKSIEEDKKSEYYKSRAESAQSSTVIYNDDPNAIEKLKDKLQKLENERANIKAREHSTWELTNIGANIRSTKERIRRLEEQENLEFSDIEFKGGKAIHNKDINRIQFLFDDKPSDYIRQKLKSNGFHWSRYEGAWQREFNKRTIWVTKDLINNVLNKEETEQEEEESEF